MRVMGGLVGWDALGFILLEVLLKWRLNSAGEGEGSTRDVRYHHNILKKFAYSETV